MRKQLAGLSDKEILLKLLDSFTEDGFVCRLGMGDSALFQDQSESESVAKKGFIGMTAAQLESFDDDGKLNGVAKLSCYLSSQELITKVMRKIQTYGFSLYAPETDIQPKRVGFLALIS
ncbi:hypothetical protein C9975_04630 [Thalassospira xiamenensis]|nr:hypothetical protein C9975_04630 [Thalassospira xiamenensis]